VGTARLHGSGGRDGEGIVVIHARRRNIMGMTVDEFVQARVLPEYREIVTALRKLMKEHAPDAVEAISYGIPAYKGRRILAVISPTKKGITFAFPRGAEFEDKYGLLVGVGKVSKNVRISRLEDLNRAALRYYIKQALAFDAEKRK
jgi:hypothetical protein